MEENILFSQPALPYLNYSTDSVGKLDGVWDQPQPKMSQLLTLPLRGSVIFMNKQFPVHCMPLIKFQIAKKVVFNSLIQIYNCLLGQDLLTFSFCHTGTCSQEEKIFVKREI